MNCKTKISLVLNLVTLGKSVEHKEHWYQKHLTFKCNFRPPTGKKIIFKDTKNHQI